MGGGGLTACRLQAFRWDWRWSGQPTKQSRILNLCISGIPHRWHLASLIYAGRFCGPRHVEAAGRMDGFTNCTPELWTEIVSRNFEPKLRTKVISGKMRRLFCGQLVGEKLGEERQLEGTLLSGGLLRILKNAMFSKQLKNKHILVYRTVLMMRLMVDCSWVLFWMNFFWYIRKLLTCVLTSFLLLCLQILSGAFKWFQCRPNNRTLFSFRSVCSTPRTHIERPTSQVDCAKRTSKRWVISMSDERAECMRRLIYFHK